ncbi:MAG: lamin tail domain-containing protein [Chitinophagaceae bacterium]|nr:MAG: lamin tail domain-containing protein [Chitinophagaceae bacterium]
MNHRIQKLLLGGLCLLLGLLGHAQSYGKVVINEYMPWPSASCGTTSEFIELLNFGPGPTNIGCYILTNGKYSVTIPPNTILQPGQFYVIAGQSSLPIGCGNIDSAVRVDLNWNTCGCTNVTIPSSGDGFMTDGGMANVNMVLFDPNLAIVDAVTRDVPVPVVSGITTSSVSSACTRKSFVLSSMTVDYEALGMSTGKSNSFARKLDGDCEWIKQPQISAHASNNKTSGGTSSLTYQFNITSSMDMCTSVRGAINVSVSGSNLSTYFPMNYTLAWDTDGNSVFDFSDRYTYGTDATIPDTTIGGLAGGRYIITVGSSKGCNLKSFPFSILPCQSLLPIKLLDFTLAGSTPEGHTFAWRLSDIDELASIELESSTDGSRFRGERRFELQPGGQLNFRTSVPRGAATHYRLRLVGTNGRPEYSRVLRPGSTLLLEGVHPNPASTDVNLDVYTSTDGPARYRIVSMHGSTLQEGELRLRAGSNPVRLGVTALPRGVYQLLLEGRNGERPMPQRFVKQ